MALAVGLMLCLNQSAAVSQEATQEPARHDVLSSERDTTILDRMSDAENAMRQELSRLATICDELKFESAGRISRSWLPHVYDDQVALFLPLETPIRASDAPGRTLSSWENHFGKARSAFADQLKMIAVDASKSNEQLAYRLLWRALRESPEQAEAKQVLGSMATSVRTRPRSAPSRTADAQLGWKVRSFNRITTPHFTILSRAEPREGIEIAQRCEEFYALWTQFFYPLWATDDLLRSRIRGEATQWPSHARMQIVLLPDREQYLQTLGVAEDNIGVSVGYYSPQAKRSFFYVAEKLDATLFHELTHQLLMEATRIATVESAGESGGVWLLEGIALYLESLQDHGTYWTVGGWTSPRMQTARYRAVRDGYWPDWSTFSAASTDQWKQSAEIARYYSHAAGLTHSLLDQPNGYDACLSALTAVYQGRAAASQELLAQFGATEAEAKEHYQDAMIVTNLQLKPLPSAHQRLTDLVLTGSQLDPQTWRQIQRLDSLQWLDVSFSNIRESDLGTLAQNHPSLKRLSLEGTAVTGQIVRQIAQLRELTELDLSGCAIHDQDLQPLQGHPTLQTLWLTQTRVTAEGLQTLARIPNLQTVDVSGSPIPPDEWKTFAEQQGLNQ